MNRNIAYPYSGSQNFQTLEELRRAVADLEDTAREMGVTASEVLFSDEFSITVRSEKLSDGSLVLNAAISIS